VRKAGRAEEKLITTRTGQEEGRKKARKREIEERGEPKGKGNFRSRGTARQAGSLTFRGEWEGAHYEMK